MAKSIRQFLEQTVWAHTPRDYRGTTPSGVRHVLRLKDGGTQSVPLTSLSDAELLGALPTARRESFAVVAAMGPDLQKILLSSNTAAELKSAIAFHNWKIECSRWANKLVGIGSIWDKEDPYELAEAAAAAFKARQAPRGFIEEIFAEDIARAEYDAHQAVESVEQASEEDEP